MGTNYVKEYHCKEKNSLTQILYQLGWVCNKSVTYITHLQSSNHCKLVCAVKFNKQFKICQINKDRKKFNSVAQW